MLERAEGAAVLPVKRAEGPCRHFVPTPAHRRGAVPRDPAEGTGACGGCASQDVAYGEQLRDKEARVRAVTEPFSPENFAPIRPSPDVFYFRNKMEFAFWPAAGRAVLGLREKGAFDRVVDVDDCRLLSPETPRLLETVRRWAAREGVPAYHLKTRAGFLRYLAVREGKNTGERMVHLVTSAAEPAAGWRDGFVAALRGSGLRIDTAVWSVNETPADVAFGRSSQVLFGPGAITESLAGRVFRVSPTAFFQTNTRGAEILYKIIEERLAPGGETLFDLYCGSGTIGLFCAPRFGRVVGVELHAPAVADARANAEALGARAAEFHAMDAARIPAEAAFAGLWKSGARAVIDPPRAGLHGPLRRLLRDSPLDRWIYVSCNPDALAKDLPVLADSYVVESVEPVDLFPHTAHVETVVTLRRKDK